MFFIGLLCISSPSYLYYLSDTGIISFELVDFDSEREEKNGEENEFNKILIESTSISIIASNSLKIDSHLVIFQSLYQPENITPPPEPIFFVP